MANYEVEQFSSEENLTMGELRNKLAQMNIPISGARSVLMARLNRALGAGQSNLKEQASSERSAEKRGTCTKPKTKHDRDVDENLGRLRTKELRERLAKEDASSEEETDYESETEDDEKGESERRSVRDGHQNCECCRKTRRRTTLSFQDVQDALEVFTDENNENINQWFRTFEETASMCMWTEEQKVICTKKLMRGSAEIFVNYECHARTWLHHRLQETKKRDDEGCTAYMYRMLGVASHMNMKEAAKMRYIVEGIRDKEVNKAILYGAKSMKELKENLITYEEQKSRIAESSVGLVRAEDNRKYRQSGNVVKYRRCHNCGDKEHVSADCPNKSRGAPQLENRIIKFDSIGAVNVHTMGQFKTEIVIDGFKATLDFDIVPDNYLGHDVLLGIELTEQLEIRVEHKQVKFIQIKKEQRVNHCAVEVSEWNEVLNIDVCSEENDRDKVELDHIGEKQQEIEILRKERDLERERITKAANQADQTEQSLISVVKEYEQYREKMQKTVTDAEVAFSKLLEEKNALALQLEEEKRKFEDLQFRFEEKSGNKDDIQKERSEQCVINTVNENKIKDLEMLLLEERERVGQLERVSIKSFETEEEMTRLRNEVLLRLFVSNATAQETQQIEDLQSRNKTLEESRNNLEDKVQEKRIIIEQCINQKTELQSKLKENQQESAVHKESQKSLRTEIERATKDLEKRIR
ncbi:thyroid receptor-interacting protein 11-like [Bombus impatiens]|uniref:Thyroid receptor-interacting protein 11-like n=1 Tax=Bombus impatiens TaxID=132113 RepID=A0A6P3UL01_BOMIM|nr:thyroid receptor-interacting protein 11-like [Bombus impatiens]